MSIFWITLTPKIWQWAGIQNTGTAYIHNFSVQQCLPKNLKTFHNNTNRILHSFYTCKRKSCVDNLKVFITSCELNVFRNSEFSVQKINISRSCWLGCLVAGSTVSKPDKGLNVSSLCLLCFAKVWVSATSWSPLQRSHIGWRVCLIVCDLETCRI